ncbi:MAG: Ig-like domain-containing protein, partial [Candidatus Poribacteria bacterium]|nr:Ig-like domain-containing protein [Candidatus Poribacteria bacterium]
APQGVVKADSVTVSALVTDEQSDITGGALTVFSPTGEEILREEIVAVEEMPDGEETPAGEVAEGEVAEAAAVFSVQVSNEVTGLTDGTYTATVVAQSAGGTSTRTWTFTVELDKTPPELVTFSPLGVIRTARPVASATVSDASGINTDTLTIIIAGVTGTQGSGRRSSPTSTTVTFTPLIDVTPGPYTVRVTVEDVHGNRTEAEWRFTVELDTTPPAITTTSPHGIVRIDKPSISVSASDDLSGVDTFEITPRNSRGQAINGVTQATSDSTSATFTPTEALEGGTYTVDVKVTDKSGNTASSKWSFTVEFDTVAPSVTNLSPQGAARVLDRRPTISAIYTDNQTGVDEASIKLSLDGVDITGNAEISANQAVYTPPGDLEFGPHTVKLEVADLAPKVNRAIQEWTFIVELDRFIMVNPRNFPNPFTDSTNIAFTLSRPARVTIEIYDITSRLVRQFPEDVIEAGPVRIEWDGTTGDGEKLARGVYFCQIIAHSDFEPAAAVLKMAIMRDE